MADISSIILPGGGTYDLKDKNAVPKYGMGKNILDNSDFRNPVNQRGQSSYTGANTYGISRWKTTPSSGSAVEVSTGTVTVSETGSSYGGMLQIVSKEPLLGKTVTLSIMYKRKSGGVFNFSLRQGAANNIGSALSTVTEMSGNVDEVNLAKVMVTVPSTITASNSIFFAIHAPNAAASVDVIAAKLELGTEQTLAHQENGTWVLNEIPDYEYELYRCITSTADSTDTYANKSLATVQQTAPAGYGLGSYFAYLLTSSDNLNTVAEGGFYRWSSGSIPSNSPISGAGLLLNSPSNAPGHSATQVVSDLSNNKQYYRTYSGGWKNWKSLATRQDLTSIEATGTTNTTGAAIPTGALFYLNEILYRAKEQIGINVLFTPETNCEQIMEGGFNAFLPSITNGTLDTTKVSGYAQAISAGSLHMVFFKLTTSVAVATSDTLVSFPSGNAPETRQLPLQFLFQRPSDTSPVIRGDRAGAYFNTNGTITQSLSNALTVGTLLQGFFIWIG